MSESEAAQQVEAGPVYRLLKRFIDVRPIHEKYGMTLRFKMTPRDTPSFLRELRRLTPGFIADDELDPNIRDEVADFEDRLFTTRLRSKATVCAASCRSRSMLGFLSSSNLLWTAAQVSPTWAAKPIGSRPNVSPFSRKSSPPRISKPCRRV